MNQEYVALIIEKLKQCEDMSLLNFIYTLLKKHQLQGQEPFVSLHSDR